MIKVINAFIFSVFGSVWAVAWLMGAVLAKGFWSSFFSIFIPPYAWYLVTEKVMQVYGVLQ